MRFKILGLALCAVLVASSVLAQQGSPNGFVFFLKGQDLHDMCLHWGEERALPYSDARDQELAADSKCQGFISGTIEGLSLDQWDPPNQASQRQIIAVVKKYVDNHPEQWDQRAKFLIRSAVIEAWPVGKKQ